MYKWEAANCLSFAEDVHRNMQRCPVTGENAHWADASIGRLTFTSTYAHVCTRTHELMHACLCICACANGYPYIGAGASNQFANAHVPWHGIAQMGLYFVM